MALRRVLLLVSAGALLAAGNSAFGAVAHTSVVRADPADFTPQVEGGGAAVHALAQRGRTVYAGGTFQNVTNAAGEASQQRRNLVSFDADTGAVTSLDADVEGTVWAIRPAGQWLYVGGDFTRVNGVSRVGLARIHATTGEVDEGFNARLNGRVTEIHLVASRLLVGGRFSERLLALDPDTGADTGYIDLPITGNLSSASDGGEVYRFAVNRAGTRLVAIGNFRAVGDSPRSRAFMLNLGSRTATLSRWYYDPLANTCRGLANPDYLRDVDFSPDGTYFVVVARGIAPRPGGFGRDVCDGAARFETNILDARRPTWVNYTGGDTLHSVAATGAAVYAQGHQQRFNAPAFAGGVRLRVEPVSRVGIAALNSRTGRALPWNPGKTRGVGGKEFLATADGLWVGSDGVQFGGETHRGIAFCPR